jgi:hypothetical protein
VVGREVDGGNLCWLGVEDGSLLVPL